MCDEAARCQRCQGPYFSSLPSSSGHPTYRHPRDVLRSVEITLDVDLVKQAPAKLAAATPDQFAAEVGPYLSKMANLAARLANGADRDDIVQEALTRAWLKRSQFDPSRGLLSSWLLAITADEARKTRLRNLHRRLPALEQRSEQSPDERIDIELALRHLSPRQRLAVECFYFAGLSVLETATVMHCSEGTVKSTLADARRALRRWLGPRA